MAGFEVVVRPVTFPNIRPNSPRSLPPQDDPEKGAAIIRGNGAKSVNLGYSFNMSMSKSRPTETERRVDEVRVYQEQDDGTINRHNFIDVEAANKITMSEGAFTGFTGDDVVPTYPGRGYTGDDLKEYFYQREEQEKKNIEVKRRDVIKRNGEEFKG